MTQRGSLGRPSRKATSYIFMTRQELQEYLRISRASVFKLLKANEIPVIRIGRKLLFRKDDIDRWLDSKVVK